MPQAMDAHSSFVYLVDNLPTWKSNIQSLSAHASQKHAEFVAEFARLVHQAKPKRKKTASVASIRTTDAGEGEEQEGDVTSLPRTVEINPFEAGNRYLYAQAMKKRKPGTSLRSTASGPQTFRNKNQVVVYYDGHLQEQLDAMMKSIGVGRNNLRKGKNSYVAERGFRLPTLRGPHAYPSVDNMRNSMISRTTSTVLSGKKALESAIPPVADDVEAAFLQVDKELESIQSLCETAAHQFLRDGDCKAELNNIQHKFNAVLQQAISTAASLEKLKEHEQAQTQQERSSEAESGKPAFALPSVGHVSKISAFERGTLSISNTLEDMKARGAFFSAPAISHDAEVGLMTDNIEVDDASEQSSIIVDITQYRLANSRRTRI